MAGSNGVAAIVPAAGAGQRFGGRVPKTQIQIAGVPVLVHVLRRLQQAPSVDAVFVSVRAQDFEWISALRKQYRLSKLQAPVLGGAVRLKSVAHACREVAPSCRWVLIHDAARPCVRVDVIESVIRAARRYGAAACGLPAAMTVKSVSRNGIVEATLDRSRLRLIQTPQAARRELLLQALAGKTAAQLGRYPDDMALLEAQGAKVKIVDGDPWNLKITTPEDAELAGWVLKRRRKP